MCKLFNCLLILSLFGLAGCQHGVNNTTNSAKVNTSAKDKTTKLTRKSCHEVQTALEISADR